MDSRLESLITETDWQVTHVPRGASHGECDQFNRKVERNIVSIDKILKLDPELLDDCRPALERIVLYGLEKSGMYKRMMTAALSITAQTSKYHACESCDKLFNRLLHLFVRLHRTKRIEYIYELSCISKTLQNMMLGNGFRQSLDHPRQLVALLGICERGFDYDTHEISPKLILAIMFKWPRPTGIKVQDDEYAVVLENYLKLIWKKLELESIPNAQSRLHLMFAMICIYDNAPTLLPAVSTNIIMEQMNRASDKARLVFDTYFVKWFQVCTDEPNLRTDLALISCRVLRRLIVSNTRLFPTMSDDLYKLLLPKSIYIIDTLIGRLKSLFAPSYDEEDTYILRLSPFDRLIPHTLYRFFMTQRPSGDASLQSKLVSSVDENSKRRLLRIVEYVCSRSSTLVYADGRTERTSLRPHPEHIWAQYIEQAIKEVQSRQTASVRFRVDSNNVARRVKSNI